MTLRRSQFYFSTLKQTRPNTQTIFPSEIYKEHFVVFNAHYKTQNILKSFLLTVCSLYAISSAINEMYISAVSLELPQRPVCKTLVYTASSFRKSYLLLTYNMFSIIYTVIPPAEHLLVM